MFSYQAVGGNRDKYDWDGWEAIGGWWLLAVCEAEEEWGSLARQVELLLVRDCGLKEALKESQEWDQDNSLELEKISHKLGEQWEGSPEDWASQCGVTGGIFFIQKMSKGGFF